MVIRHRDKKQKLKMKQYADKRRHTAVMKIKVGDMVLCKQERKHSLTPLYDPDPMVVIGVKGRMITAKNNVKIRTRNYADWKLLKNGCKTHLSRTLFQLTERVQNSPEQTAGKTQCQRIEYANLSMDKSSPEQRATQSKMNVCRERNSPQQTATQSKMNACRERIVTVNKDIQPVTGPEGK